MITIGSLFDGIAGFPLAAVRHGIKGAECPEAGLQALASEARAKGLRRYKVEARRAKSNYQLSTTYLIRACPLYHRGSLPPIRQPVMPHDVGGLDLGVEA